MAVDVGVVVHGWMALTVPVPLGEADSPAILHGQEMRILLRLSGQDTRGARKPERRVDIGLEERFRDRRWNVAREKRRRLGRPAKDLRPWRCIRALDLTCRRQLFWDLV